MQAEHLHYIVTHVFLPPKLPQKDDQKISMDWMLCDTTYQHAIKFQRHLHADEATRWAPIVRMLRCLRDSQQYNALDAHDIQRSMTDMQPGDVFALLVRAQNAAVMMRKSCDDMIFESFEVAPPAAEVMKATGKLRCSYPGPAIAVPLEIVDNPSFGKELASFLVQMNVDLLDSAAMTKKAKSVVPEERDSAHPRYITQLLTGILRGMGRAVDIPRIWKRIADDVLWNDAYKPWRRSSIWLVVRVALQTSLHNEHVDPTHNLYKYFMAFLMAGILRTAVQSGLSSDLLFCMRAKVSRRLYKLGSAAPEHVLREVTEAGMEAEGVLQQRWLAIQKDQAKSAYWAPDELDILNDTHLTLNNSRAYLTQALQMDPVSGRPSSFQPHHFPRLRDTHLDSFLFDVNGMLATFNANDLTAAFDADPAVALADFELLVQNDLDNWVIQNLLRESAVVSIAACITEYHKTAIKNYSSNPENWSLMLLTVFDLWVALDKMVVAQCPLLRDYSPEVTLKLFEPLLLRKREPLKRLSIIEAYLHVRHQEASGLSVFTDEIVSNSFAVRYFNQDSSLKSLKEHIEAYARQERERKIQELHLKNQEHSTLTDMVRDMEHKYSGLKAKHKQKKCKKCALQREADSLRIEVHEWPLPADELKARATVFELCCPLVFRTWRTTTYQVLHDICREFPAASVKFEVELKEYIGLREFLAHEKISRITYASTTKSFHNSHYKMKSLPTSESFICVNNGLQYKLFDNITSSWAADQFHQCSIAHRSTVRLPITGRYKTLQYTIDGTQHTSNEILALQSECPKDMSIHEYIAFGTLRSGGRLQWLNILRELSCRSLTFHQEEVHDLLTQSAWQVGPSAPDREREWHADLTVDRFGHRLLQQLEDLLHSVATNWLEGTTVQTAVMLTTRLLASTVAQDVRRGAFKVLREARMITVGWTRELASKLQGSGNQPDANDLRMRLCEMAATCRSTYDVDPTDLAHLLDSDDDVAICIECAIRIHGNKSSTIEDMPSHLRRLLSRDQRLSHFLEKHLFERVERSRHGFDTAIKAIWTAYCPGTKWTKMSRPNNRWITSYTANPESYQDSQQVHINLLDGNLLVNGQPLGRLPPSIIGHPIYKRIFAERVLDVIPADMPGMEFATRSPVCHYQVFFSLQNNNDLVIRTRQGSEILQYVPHATFEGDIPASFVEHYAHWLRIPTESDRSQSEIEFRPFGRLWRQSSDNWHIHFSLTHYSVMQMNSRIMLVDNRSNTFRMVSSQLEPLEDARHMEITCQGNEDLLLVSLPRYGLSFQMNSNGQLESVNLSGMIIDPDQSMGAMFGLLSRLVLRPKDPTAMEFPFSRRVIIPHGDPHFEPEGDHDRVIIDVGSQARVRYLEYKINTDLGYFVGNSSLVSRLYKVYLHAITSHCLPDPLTGRTGTEEALLELNSAGCWSFQKLGIEEATLLNRISNLSSHREYYPAHLKVMQKVSWSSLSSIAQHPRFFDIAQSIMKYAENLNIFDEDLGYEAGYSDRSSLSNDHLRDRAALRAYACYSPGSGCLLSGTDGDQNYTSRHFTSVEEAQQETGVAEVSSLINNWPSKLATSHDLLHIIRGWSHLSIEQDTSLCLSFSRDWLKIDLPSTWITLYNLNRSGVSEHKKFQLAFSLSAMSYSLPKSRDLVPTILSFAIVPQFNRLDPPRWSSYDLSKGFKPARTELLKIITSLVVPLTDDLAASIPSLASIDRVEKETEASFRKRCQVHHSRIVDSQAADMADDLVRQWPCREPQTPPYDHPLLFDITTIMNKVKDRYLCWWQNYELHDHISEVQEILDHVRVAVPPTSPAPVHISPKIHLESQSPRYPSMTIDTLLRRDAPDTIFPPEIPPEILRMSKTYRGVDTERLQSLLSEFQKPTRTALHRQYGSDLDESRKVLDNQLIPIFPESMLYPFEALMFFKNQCRQYLKNIYATICKTLSPRDPVESVIFAAGQWPRLTPKSLLSLLVTTSSVALTPRWLTTLVSYARAFLLQQRSQRLMDFACRRSHEEFFKELESSEIEEQVANRNTDWLVIQIESQFSMRPLQYDVAQEMAYPTAARNVVLQLNMGEGKSSVIIPLVAAELADGHKLVRVVVLKPLASQMFQLLVERLGGLANRRIFYMPFSRKIKTDLSRAQLIRNLYEICAQTRGILLVQPEHMLSFKLMGIDHLMCSMSSQASQIANSLVDSQRWLQMKSRDIIDESDEILHVRFQLVYTIGQRRPLEDNPDRWTTVQQLFTLVKKHIHSIHADYPQWVEFQDSFDGCYPYIRILHADAARTLMFNIAQDVVNGALSNHTLRLLPQHVRKAALRYITDIDISDDDPKAHLVQEFCKGGTWNGVLLLRGLLAHKILEYVLTERRWRVDFGLDLSRSLLAVPYRAKDVPALSAEFGHPDVAIALTCLAYYYTGLTENQLDLCFQLLFKHDSPDIEYEKWIHGNNAIPPSLRELIGINLEDVEQREHHLIPLFRRNQVVIDFYLSQVVFPKEAKEYPQKLATSGWDLAECKHNSTTGFSGTNDNSYLLPTSIIQCDPQAVHQTSTNAKVLTYLLYPENNKYLCIRSDDGQQPSARGLLKRLVGQTEEIRVLLDIGAQMLELTNVQLVSSWLSVRPDISAGIFFNEADELTVLTQDSTLEPFISSPFNQQLDKCLVYLDDAHTRGTDLKLPRDTRAAVTLGPKVTKDRLLQGCMRMRKLGHGQSVMFIAPPEVDRKIRHAAGKGMSEHVEVLDILRWTMLETCADIEHHLPLWAQQGYDYGKRKDAWNDFTSSGGALVESVKTTWLQREGRTLEEMYGLHPTTFDSSSAGFASNHPFTIPELRQRCETLGVSSLSDTSVSEEQEREVDHEVEQERQVQRPPNAIAAVHQVHASVRQFIRTGVIAKISNVFVPIFSSLSPRIAVPREDRLVWSAGLLATKDFLTTVTEPSTDNSDYLRPVTWILSNRRVLVVLSPYEANDLLPDIRQSQAVHLHMYAPRVTQPMRSFDDLRFYCIPPLPSSWVAPNRYNVMQLNLWAGQLYLADYKEYVQLCDFLGIYTEKYLNTRIENDGFIKPQHRLGAMRTLCKFTTSPVQFLKELISLRRKGIGFSSSHLGRILHARYLTEEDF
ncbi:hypothetical protein AcV5_009969 [Taiwanofungus camphoratus]|nr:hypothetical protein AcV5_009969 [Antrodia cinnamomea]